MKPTVSVIIPCFNQGRFLPDAIHSLINQTYENWECIIINDGSIDDTATVAAGLAKTDARLQVINQSNQGLCAARNAGLIVARGEMIQFLDADDNLEKDKLRFQSRFLQNHPEIDIVFGEARYFTTENPELRDSGYYATKGDPWISDLWNAPGSTLKKSISRTLFPVNCPLVRRSVFDRVGMWNEKLQAHEDWELWIRCATKDVKMQLLTQPNTLALIRMHNTSMTFDTPRMQHSEFQMRVVIGPLIKEPSLRILNVKNGLKTLRLLQDTHLLKPLTQLVFANFSVRVTYIALYFYLTECTISRSIANTYKRFTPWPIQKRLTKLFTRVQNK